MSKYLTSRKSKSVFTREKPPRQYKTTENVLFFPSKKLNFYFKKISNEKL
jgi:hypothetical protein